MSIKNVDSLLKKHIELSHGEKFPCAQCDYSTADKQLMKAHVRDKHSGIVIKCDICDKTYANTVTLKYVITELTGIDKVIVQGSHEMGASGENDQVRARRMYTHVSNCNTHEEPLSQGSHDRRANL